MESCNLPELRLVTVSALLCSPFSSTVRLCPCRAGPLLFVLELSSTSLAGQTALAAPWHPGWGERDREHGDRAGLGDGNRRLLWKTDRFSSQWNSGASKSEENLESWYNYSDGKISQSSNWEKLQKEESESSTNWTVKTRAELSVRGLWALSALHCHRKSFHCVWSTARCHLIVEMPCSLRNKT